MKHLFIQTTLVVFFSFCSINLFAEDTIEEKEATTASYGSVTFKISGHAGTYYFYYPEQKVISHNGLGITEVSMNVTATAGLSGAVVEVKVVADSHNSNQIGIFSLNYKANLDLINGTTSFGYLVPLKNGKGTAQMALMQ